MSQPRTTPVMTPAAKASPRSRWIDDRHVVGAASPALAAARGDRASCAAGDDRRLCAGLLQRRRLIDRALLSRKQPRLIVVGQEIVDHRQKAHQVLVLPERLRHGHRDYGHDARAAAEVEEIGQFVGHDSRAARNRPPR